MERNLPWPEDENQPENAGELFVPADARRIREELLACFKLHEEEALEGAMDELIVRKMTKEMRMKLPVEINLENNLGGMISQLKERLCQSDRGAFLQRAIELLHDEETPLWRKIGLTRISMIRIAKMLDIDVTELKTSKQNDEIINHLEHMITRRGLQ